MLTMNRTTDTNLPYYLYHRCQQTERLEDCDQSENKRLGIIHRPPKRNGQRIHFHHHHHHHWQPYSLYRRTQRGLIRLNQCDPSNLNHDNVNDTDHDMPAGKFIDIATSKKINGGKEEEDDIPPRHRANSKPAKKRPLPSVRKNKF